VIDQEEQKHQGAEHSQVATLLLEADMDCHLTIDGEDQGRLERDYPRSFLLPLGYPLIHAATQDGLVGKEWVQPLYREEEVVHFIHLADEHAQARAKLEEEMREPLGIECLSVEQIQQEQLEAAKKAGLAPVFRDGPDYPEMVVIPAGSYRMGDTSDKHKVTITRSFAVGKYPVTVEEWRRYVDAKSVVIKEPMSVYFGAPGDGSEVKPYVEPEDPPHRPSDNGWIGETLPVTNVSWFDAQDYARWLTAQTGQTYRLLTEAEWEYVCRAGSVTEYYWGDEIGDNNCNCQDSGSKWSCKRASRVGSFAPNVFGVHDMLGNVWEWVEDHWHNNYEGAPADETAWTYGGNQQGRVVRGGSWDCSPKLARSASRARAVTSSRYDDFGFRIASTLDEPAD
jgi:formylglycine-generating enzyme required for sulfatase activity